MSEGGSQCLQDECPEHLDARGISRASKFTESEIKAGRLLFAELPASLRVLVAVLDWTDGAAETFETMSAPQLGAFVQAVATWQASNDLDPDGLAGSKTRARMASGRALAIFADLSGAMDYSARRYSPGSEATRDLAADACTVLGLSRRLGESDGLHNIIRRESGGYVGRPNYTIHLDGVQMSDTATADDWPKVWKRLRSGDVGELWPEGVSHSTACGLGQLLSSNMARLGPTGVDGYGDALAEMCALISYVLARYRAPGASAVEAFEDAWRFYTLPRFSGPKSARPKWCRYSWRALKKYGGGNQKPGEGY